MPYVIREQMKKQQVQSYSEREQMALDHEIILQEQEKLRLLNQQLQTQVVALQNNQDKRGGQGQRVSYLHALDELIQKRIGEAKLQNHLITLTTKILDFPLSEEIEECEFSRKFSTPTFDHYSR